MYLAHDIRTPLTSVIGYLSLLKDVPDMPAAQKAMHLHITLEKANRLEIAFQNKGKTIPPEKLPHVLTVLAAG